MNLNLTTNEIELILSLLSKARDESELRLNDLSKRMDELSVLKLLDLREELELDGLPDLCNSEHSYVRFIDNLMKKLNNDSNLKNLTSK